MSDVPPDSQQDGEPSGTPPPAPPPYPGSQPPAAPQAPQFPPPPPAPPQYPGAAPTYPPGGATPPASGGYVPPGGAPAVPPGGYQQGYPAPPGGYIPPAGYPPATGSGSGYGYGYGGPGYPPPPAPPGFQASGYQEAGYPAVSPYASYGARLGGWLIDFVIVGVIGYVIGIIFDAGHVARVTVTTNTTTHGVTVHHVGHFSVLGPIVQVAIVLLYGAIFCGSRRGQTVGMMAVGARAVDRDTGAPIGFGRALGRGAFEYLMFIIIVIPWVVDMLFPAWDSRRQTLHDKVSRTVVVKSSLYPPT
ncbi:MAG TPA: RDD family protein [Acidimicrobiales bacterium]|nr:RDD family protein [Acidimicrobiales bacterium]